MSSSNHHDVEAATGTTKPGTQTETHHPFMAPLVGCAAIGASLSFIVGFVLFGTILSDLADDDLTDAQKLETIKDNEQVYYLSNMVLYILFGFAQLTLTVGMAQSAKSEYPILAPVSQALGIVWSTLVLAAGMIGNIGAEAALDLLEDAEGENAESAAAAAVTLWTTIRTLHNSLGGGNEIVGGAWLLVAAYCYYFSQNCKAGIKDKATMAIGMIAGLAGVVSTVPVAAEGAVVVFGIGMIVWYLMIGIKVAFFH